MTQKHYSEIPNEVAEASKRAQRVAWILDSSIPLPFGIRIGLDAIIGLLPAFGDSLGGILSSYIIAEAVKAGVPFSIIMRMILNVLFDMCLGAIPFVGDLLDFAIKANRKNAALFESYILEPRETRKRSSVIVALVLLGFLACVAAVGYLLFMIFAALWTLVRNQMA